jgi:hypothetical protein
VGTGSGKTDRHADMFNILQKITPEKEKPDREGVQWQYAYIFTSKKL